MKNTILAAVMAGATVLGLGVGAAVFADDIDRQLASISEDVQADLAQSDGSDADGWVRVGFGVRPVIGVRPAFGVRRVGWGGWGVRRGWVPGAWGWGGYRRGYYRAW
jgi:hypothetical protein